MNRQKIFHPASKGISVILAMMILLVQFTEAFHHHKQLDGNSWHQQISAKAKLQVRVECVICHYFAHHYAPVQAEQTHFSFVNSIILLPSSATLESYLISGLHFILSNKGPPVYTLVLTSYTI